MFEMKRYGRILMILAFVVGTFLVGIGDTAHARFILTIEEFIGGVGGAKEIIIDDTDGGIGDATPKGAATIGDLSAGDGIIHFFGAVGGFTVTVTTAFSKPLIGPARVDTSISALSTVAGTRTLEIMITDTDFGPTGLGGVRSKVGGTTNGTVTVEGITDPGNGEFVSTFTTGVLGPFGPGAFSNDVSVSTPILTPPFSISGNVRITHTGAGQLTTLDHEVSVVPEPSTLLLFGVGLIGFAAIARRRKKA